MKTWKIVITGMLLGTTCYAYNCFVNGQTSCKATGSHCGMGQSTCINQCNVTYSGTVTDPGLRNICIPAKKDEHGWSDCIYWADCGYECTGTCPTCGVQNTRSFPGPAIMYATNQECDG